MTTMNLYLIGGEMIKFYKGLSVKKMGVSGDCIAIQMCACVECDVLYLSRTLYLFHSNISWHTRVNLLN